MSPGTLTRLHRHAAALALAGLGLAAPDAHAAIVANLNVNIPIPSDTFGVYLNVITGATSSNPALVPGWDVNLWGASDLRAFAPSPNPGGGAYVGSGTQFNNIPFSFALTVGPSNTYTNTGTATLNPLTPWTFNSNLNGIGFRFINEFNANQVHYGFMVIRLSGSAASQPRLITDYFYESIAGQPLVFPSPGAAGLALVAAAAATRRRRG